MRLSSADLAFAVFDVGPLALCLGAGGVVLGGVVAFGTARGRRNRRRVRTAGDSPDQHLLDDPRLHALMTSALRELVAGLAVRDEPIPDIRVFFAEPQRIVAHLTVPAAQPPPAPWRADPGDRRWTVDAVEVRRWERGALPFPALVPIGTAHGWKVLLDLEQAPGLISIGGPPHEAMRIVNALAFELGTSEWATEVSVTMVGFDTDIAVPDPDRIRHVASIEDALGPAEQAARRASMVLGRLDAPNAATGRHRDGGLALNVLLLARPPSEAHLDRVAKLAGDAHSSVVVVCVGDSPLARWTFLGSDDGRLVIEPLGLSVDPVSAAVEARQRQLRSVRRPPAPRMPDIHAVAATAGDPRHAGRPDAPTVVLHRSAASDGPTETQVEVPRPALLTRDQARGSVGAPGAHLSARPARGPAGPPAPRPSAPPPDIRVLGPVEVAAPGPVAERDRALLTRLAVVAAAHPEGLTDALVAGLPWGPAAVEGLRTWLGQDGNGGPRLVRHGSGWRLAPDVGVDLARFRAGAAAGEAADDPTAMVDALASIRGELWTPDAVAGDQVRLELTLARDAVRAAVIGTVRRATDLAAERGDHRLVEWALRQGLRLLPRMEALWCVLLTFYAEHDRSAVGPAVERMRALLGGAPPEPETARLLAQLDREAAPRRAGA